MPRAGLSREFCSLCVPRVRSEQVQFGVKVVIKQLKGVVYSVGDCPAGSLQLFRDLLSEEGKCSGPVLIAYKKLQRSNVNRGRGEWEWELGALEGEQYRAAPAVSKIDPMRDPCFCCRHTA